MKTEMNTLQMS